MSRESMGEASVQAFAAWAGAFPWHTWSTLTYAPVSPYSGREQNPTVRSARRAIAWLLERGRVQAAVWVTERGKRFGRVHNHALLSFFPSDPWSIQVDQDETVRTWERTFGWMQAEPFDPVKGAAGYCGKYLRKQDCDWDLWQASNNSPTKPGQSRNAWARTTNLILPWQSVTRRPTSPSALSAAGARRRSQAGTGIPPTSAVYFNGTRRATPESSTNPPDNPGTYRILVRDSQERLT